MTNYCPDCGASAKAHTGTYCHECGTNFPVKNKTWWAALDNGDVWPCKVLGFTPFGTRVEVTHGNDEHYESIAGKTFILDRKRVYDSSFKHPTREDVAA